MYLQLATLLGLLDAARAQGGDRCTTEFNNARPQGLPQACWPGGSLSGNALDWSCDAGCAELFIVRHPRAPLPLTTLSLSLALHSAESHKQRRVPHVAALLGDLR